MTEIIPSTATERENAPTSNPEARASGTGVLPVPSVYQATQIQNSTTGGMFGAPPVRPVVAPLSMADWKVRNYDELEQRVRESGSGEFVIEDLLPKASLGLLIGDSGLGKSPLLYQACICVAAGLPFLGHATRQGDVLYCDFENGTANACKIVRCLSSYLGLPTVPANLRLWNFNDCADRYGQAGYTIGDMVLGYRPTLVVIDSLTAYNPLIEDGNPNATKALQELRGIMRASGATFICVHHLRKPSARAQDAPRQLEDGNVRDWFKHARGPSALINGSDIRIGLDSPQLAILTSDAEAREEVAFVLRGFGRVSGEVGPIYVARVLDDEGEPLGYRQIVGAELLFNPHQQAVLASLGQAFSFGEAKRAYGRQDQATSDFLKKAQRIGLIRKVGRGRFEKTPHSPERAERASSSLNAQGLVEGGTPGAERSAAE